MRKLNFYAMLTLLFVALLPLFTACTEDDLESGNENTKVSIAFSSSEISVPAEESNQEVSFTLQNVGENYKVEATTENDWITSLSVVDVDNVVKFTVSANETSELREGKITLVYTSGSDTAEASLVVKQDFAEGVNSYFKLSVPETGSTWAAISLEAEDDNMRYIISCLDADTMEGYVSDDVLIADDLSYYQQLASYYGLSLEDVIDILSYKGDIPSPEQGELAFTLLDTETEYYAYCYGFDSNLNVVTPVTKVKFSTKSVGSENLTIEFENVKPSARSVSFDILASSFDSYTCIVLPKSMYEESIGNMEAFKNDLATSNYSDFGGSSTDNTISGLNPNTDFVLVAMGRADDTPTSDIFTYEFTTLDAVESSAKFTFEYGYCDGVELESQYQVFGQDMTGYSVIYPKPSVQNGVDYRFNFFNSTIKDISDDEIISTLSLSTGGYGSESEGMVYALPYDTDIYVCGVGIDADGNYGTLYKELINLTKNGEGYLSVEEFMEYMGIYETMSRSYVAPWLKEIKDVNKMVKPVAIGLQPKKEPVCKVKGLKLK